MALSRWFAVTALSVALFAATAEVAVRALHPVPRVQVIDLPQRHTTWIDGEPVWAGAGVIPTPDPCPAPGGLVVLLLGDSIPTMGTDTPEETTGPRLAHHLQAALGRPVCVRVAARPGLPLRSQLAFARSMADGVDAVVAQVWRPTGRWALIGSRWWIDTTDIAVTDGGLPRPPIPMPDLLHRAVLTVSEAWFYATLALAVPDPIDVDRALVAHRALLDWADVLGVPLVYAEMPPLDRPFGAAWDRVLWAVALEAAARHRGVPWVRVSDGLAAAGHDVAAVRLDPCCHYVAPGHDAVAQVLTPAVAAVLSQDPP